MNDESETRMKSESQPVDQGNDGEGKRVPLFVPPDRSTGLMIWLNLLMLWLSALNGAIMLYYIYRVQQFGTPVPVNRYGLQAQYWSCLLALMVSITLAMNLRKYKGRKQVFVALSVVGALITLGALVVVIVMQLNGFIEVHRN